LHDPVIINADSKDPMKKVIILFLLLVNTLMSAQKAQRIGYVDLDYILENIPEYQQAQSSINAKIIHWQQDITTKQKQIDSLKNALENERVLMPEDLLVESEEAIHMKEVALKALQTAYFGTKGDLFFYRKQLVRPIQDQVYNAVREIAQKRRFDFVLDKSSELMLLYANQKFDVSELVIKQLNRDRKSKKASDKRAMSKSESAENSQDTEELEAAEKKNERDAKRIALQEKIAAKKAAQLEKRAALKAELDAKKAKKQQEREDRLKKTKNDH